MDEELRAILPNQEEVPGERSGMRFYGTSTVPPDVAFKQGIPLKGDDRRLLAHVNGNDNSAFRGTTAVPLLNPKLGQGAIFWATEGGWVYEVGPMMGWDPGRLLEGRVNIIGLYWNAPNSMEGEISVPSRIEPGSIYKAALVKEKGDSLGLGTWIYNPNYHPTR